MRCTSHTTTLENLTMDESSKLIRFSVNATRNGSEPYTYYTWVVDTDPDETEEFEILTVTVDWTQEGMQNLGQFGLNHSSANE